MFSFSTAQKLELLIQNRLKTHPHEPSTGCINYHQKCRKKLREMLIRDVAGGILEKEKNTESYHATPLEKKNEISAMAIKINFHGKNLNNIQLL